MRLFHLIFANSVRVVCSVCASRTITMGVALLNHFQNVSKTGLLPTITNIIHFNESKNLTWQVPINSSNTSSLGDTISLSSAEINKLKALKNGVYDNLEYTETITLVSDVWIYNTGEASAGGKGFLVSVANSGSRDYTATNTSTAQLSVITTSKDGTKRWALCSIAQSSISYIPRDTFFDFTGASFSAYGKVNSRSGAKVTRIAYSLDVYAW